MTVFPPKYLARISLLLCLWVSVFSSAAVARDFMGIPIDENVLQKSKPLPTWLYGGGGFLSYYASSIDGGVKLSVERRLHPHFSLDICGMMFLGNDLYEASLDGRYYFRGSLMSSKNDDFLRLGVSAIYMEKGGESYMPPAISLGYGRDVLFFENAHFLGRFEIRGIYVIGEPISKKDDHRLVTQESHLLVNLELSLIFF